MEVQVLDQTINGLGSLERNGTNFNFTTVAGKMSTSSRERMSTRGRGECQQLQDVRMSTGCQLLRCFPNRA